MSTDDRVEKTINLQQQQLDALERANKQQLEALAQQRELAMESAKYGQCSQARLGRIAGGTDCRSPGPPRELYRRH
jgi:hypothetical protein